MASPRFHFGTAGIGGLWGPPDKGVAFGALDAAFDLARPGRLALDVAPFYGSALETVGEWMRGLSAQELAKIDLTVKVGRIYNEDPFNSGPWQEPAWDFTPGGEEWSIEQSLAQLQLDADFNQPKAGVKDRPTLTVYQHDPDIQGEPTEVETGWQFLQDLKQRGVVNRVGIGSNNPQYLSEWIRSHSTKPDEVLCAGAYNLRFASTAQGLLQACNANSIPLLNAGVFASGFLVGAKAGPVELCGYRPATDEDRRWREDVRQVCAKNASEVGLAPERLLVAAALQFAAKPDGIELVHGASTAAELRSATELLRADLPGRFWDELAPLLPTEVPFTRIDGIPRPSLNRGVGLEN